VGKASPSGGLDASRAPVRESPLWFAFLVRVEEFLERNVTRMKARARGSDGREKGSRVSSW
jgi:hypothetical protein